jgi:HTH-type transcriptional regulator / antitoxin HigA
MSGAKSPVLLRASVRGKSDTDVAALQLWHARASQLARQRASRPRRDFDFVDLSWTRDLVKLSPLSDGPRKAIEFLEDRGVCVVCERHLPRTYVDGAAFLVDDRPVIALSLRFDRLDNFWFTLLHELGHIFLHHANGLEEGFFDDIECDTTDQLEQEADRFASDALIPSELWKTSPARFAKTIDPMRKFARSIGIHEAIVVGRIRRERGYSMYSDFVGQGEVRKLLLPEA